jgi:predicted transcriptional regulator
VIRFSLTLSDDLNREIDLAAQETETSKNEILRKALALYLAAREGQKRGLKLGFAKSGEALETEIIGL